MSKLTFIVPIHKPDLVLLERCVRGLCDQSLTAWEAVFVLDGSCPEATKIIQSTMKKKPNYFQIIEQHQSGAQKARNRGFKHSKTPYIVFWDCDCIIEPHAAKAWVDILDSKPEIGFVYSGYKFLNEMGGIPSEPFDPWLLRVRNYISTCFPLRKTLYPGWNENLESLQDWDFWLSVVEKGGKGHFLQGYAFSTAYPTPDSISGKGHGPNKWLERMDKVKSLHNIPIRKICVTSVNDKYEGIRLAKLIDADYDDFPQDKPNHYEKIIQIGFDFSRAERCSRAWGEVKGFLFWTGANISQIYNHLSLSAIDQYSEKINKRAIQFVEDLAAQKILSRAGFKTQIMPLPIINADPLNLLPEKPKFLLDIQNSYSPLFSMIVESLPDVDFDILGGVQDIEKYTGIMSFNSEGSLTNHIKRLLLTGRHIISNIQSPFTGYIDDHQDPEKFIVEAVEKVRKVIKLPLSDRGANYYANYLKPERFMEAIKA